MSNVVPMQRPVVATELNNPEDFVLLAQSAIRTSGKTYKQLAADSNVGASTISKLACGETTYPRFHTVMKLLFALGFSFTAYRDL